MATHVVPEDQKARISEKLAEIAWQVFLLDGYEYDPELLIGHLQAATEGRFMPLEISKTADTDLDL